MAAIAYVTDETMLEYHRFNGSHSIVFWRLSSKKFSDFKEGDLLFFLSYSDVVGKVKEKGLTGCGCYTGSESLTITAMWKKYGTATGYSTKKELTDAIVKSCKTEELPKKISCLLLDKVVFFQMPIYLSKLGYNISNKLESFTYLDKNDGAQTLMLLKEAQKVGIDYWTSIVNDNLNDELFNRLIMKYQISTIYESMSLKSNIPAKKAETIFELYSDESSMWVNQQKYSFITFQPEPKLYFIHDSLMKDSVENFYRLLGELMNLRLAIKEELSEDIAIKVLCIRPLTENQIKVLENYNIEVENIEL